MKYINGKALYIIISISAMLFAPTAQKWNDARMAEKPPAAKVKVLTAQQAVNKYNAEFNYNPNLGTAVDQYNKSFKNKVVYK